MASHLVITTHIFIGMNFSFVNFIDVYMLENHSQNETRSGSRWHAITNPYASGRNCPCTTQHSFKQPGKILLVCYSTHHSLQFDMPHEHVVRNLIFDPAPPPKSHPKGCSRGHKVNPVQYVLHLSLLSICAHFHIKIFKIDFEIGNC